MDDPCDAWPVEAFCPHHMLRAGTYGGTIIVYECAWCGQTEELDRS